MNGASQNTKQKRRVVVTGIGMITPLGNTTAETWEALVQNKIGIGPITAFDDSDFKVHLAAEVKDFDPTAHLDKKEARRMDRYCQMGMVAADEAVRQAGLTAETYGADKTGVIYGTGVGGLITFETEVQKLASKGPRAVSPLFIPTMIANIAPARIAMAYGLKSDNYTVSTACASGAHAIGEAFRKIADGYMEACICGGSEACISPVAIAGFSNMTALSKETDPSLGSLPFDERRGGFVLGEGAGMVVLESLDGALARGAKILGEIVGYGSTCDAYHITSPSPDGTGAAAAMKEAMEEAGITPAQVDYINAHGTGTPLNDKYETTAIKLALGEEEAARTPISSTKGMTGHLLGAAGAIEAIICMLSIRDKKALRTVGLSVNDPECDLDYIQEGNRDLEISYALSNSLGFGGHNATLCLAKYEG